MPTYRELLAACSAGQPVTIRDLLSAKRRERVIYGARRGAVAPNERNDMPRLTAEGVAWIARNTDSMVARAALGGYGDEWPDSHVSAAITACNAKGAEFYAAREEN